MKWAIFVTSLLISVLLMLIVAMPVLADGFDYYDPATGMHYQQPRPVLADGQLFQFCVDPGGAMWACTAARAQGDSWVNDPYGMKGFTDEQRAKTWTVWSAKDELSFIQHSPSYITEVAPQPVEASLPDPEVQDCYDKGDLFRVCLDWLSIEREQKNGDQ